MEQVAKLSESDEQFMISLLGKDKFENLKATTSNLAETLEGVLGFKVLLDDEKVVPPADEEDAEDTSYTEDNPKKGKKPMKKENEAEVPATMTETTPEVTPEPVVTAPDVSTIVPEVMKVLNVEALQKVINDLLESNKSLTAEVAALKASIKPLEEIKKSDDQRIAEQLVPITWGLRVSKSQDEETVSTKTADEVQALAPKVPEKANDGKFDPLATMWGQFGQ